MFSIMRLVPFFSTATAIALVGSSLNAAESEIDFFRDIYPILQANCIACHNKTTTEGGLNMETPELMRKGGDSGPGVIPGKSAESLIIQAATHTEFRVMPPEGNDRGAQDLTPEQLKLFSDWVDQGAKHSENTVQKIHWAGLPASVHPIYAIAISPDRRVVAWGRGNDVLIADLATRQVIARLSDPNESVIAGSVVAPSHRAMVASLAFSPDSNRLATGSFREVKIWTRVPDSSPVVTLESESKILATTLNSDRTRVLAITEQGVLGEFDSNTGKPLRTIADTRLKNVTGLHLAPGGQSIAIVQQDRDGTILNLTKEKPAEVQQINDVSAFAWVDQARFVIVDSKHAVQQYVLDQKEPTATVTLPAATTNMLVAADPQKLYVADQDGQVRVVDLANSKITATWPAPGLSALAVSPDGKLLAAGCSDGVVRVIDATTGKSHSELRGTFADVQTVVLRNEQHDRHQLDIASFQQQISAAESQNKTLDELLKKATDTIATVNKALPARKQALTDAQSAQQTAQKELDALNEKLAAAAEAEQAALKKQQSAAEKKLADAKLKTEEAQAALSESENHIKDAQLKSDRMNASKKKNLAEIEQLKEALTAAQAALKGAATQLAEAKQAVTAKHTGLQTVAFSPDGQYVAAISLAGEHHLWGLATGQPVATASPKPVEGAAFIQSLPDGQFQGITPNGRLTRISSTPEWKLERRIGGSSQTAGISNRVGAVAFNPDGSLLAVGSGEPSRSGDISLWNVATGAQMAAWKEHHADAVLSLDFSSDGSLLASGAADRLAKITQVDSGKVIHLFEGHTHHVLDVSLRADDRTLATAGADAAVIVWSLESGERVRKISGWEKEVTSIEYLGASAQLLTSSGDQKIRIVNDTGSQVTEIANLPGFQYDAACAMGLEQVILSGGEDGLLRFWDGKTRKLLHVIPAEK